MILFILMALMAIPGVYLFKTGRFVSTRYGGTEYDARKCWGVALEVGALLVLIPLFIVNTVAYTNQISDKQSIIQIRQNESIYAKKAKSLTAQFRGYLAEQYPKYEKSIFQTFQRTPNLLFARYPQLKTEDALVTLTGEIDRLQSAVYDQELKITQMQKNLRTRRINPWYLGFLLP